MARGVEIPITARVLEWALDQSGFTTAEVAKTVGVPVETLEAWKSRRGRPKLTQFKKLASKLHRPQAMFLLPEPPRTQPPAVQFRSSQQDHQRALNPIERRYLRRAARFQEVLGWLVAELDIQAASVPPATTEGDPITVARTMREALAVSIDQQVRWNSPSKAFDGWRDALERTGVTVLLFSMGKESVQGFSLFDDHTPMIAVNSARREEARIFTVFHELGHLVTRTSSACVGSTIQPTDQVERWCDQFAAEVLVPRASLVESARRISGGNGHIRSLTEASGLASRFRVSLRAIVIALIHAGLASWDLYREIPASADAKPRVGGGGTGRSRREVREDEFGRRTAGLFVTGVMRDVLSRSQALDYLDVPDVEFDRIPPATPTASVG